MKCGFLVHDLAGMVDAIGRIDRADEGWHFEQHFHLKSAAKPCFAHDGIDGGDMVA
jgi:hypothetical protein